MADGSDHVVSGSRARGPTAGPKTTIQSVRRASQLLLAVAHAPDGISAKQAATQFELTLPTAYHLLATLAAEGLVVKDSRRQYLLGPRAAVIAAAVSRDTRAPEYYLDPLRELATSTGETAYLSAWRNGAITVLQSIEGQHAVRVSGLAPGYDENFHARASGKLLLAFAPAADRDRLLSGRSLIALTANTITDVPTLLTELDVVRRDSLAYDRAEFRDGVDCVAAPITEDGAVVACFTVSAPSDRWTLESERLVTAVRLAAERASNLRVTD